MLGLAIDQVTKIAAVGYLAPGDRISLVGEWFQLALYRNPGAAFGMGSGFTLAFSIFAIVALIGCLAIALPRLQHARYGFALGLLLGGITGNLLDRIFQPPSPLLGHVIDFFALKYFAVFNIADVCITVAAVLIVAFSFFEPGEDDDSEPDAGSEDSDDEEADVKEDA